MNNSKKMKIILSNEKYIDIIIKHDVDVKWLFNDVGYVCIFKYTKLYYEKYNKLPNLQTIKICAEKFTAPGQPDCKNADEINNAIRPIDGIDLDDIDKDFLNDELIDEIKKCIAYSMLIEDADELSDATKIDETMRKIQLKTECILDIANIDEDFGRDMKHDFMKYIKNLKNPLRKLSLGYEKFDEFIIGGIPIDNKYLMLFQGQTHSGKSLFLSNIGLNLAASGKNVVFISLEMSEDMYQDRLMAHHTGLNVNTLDQHIDELIDKIEDNPIDFHIKEFPADQMSCKDMETYLKKLEKKRGKFDCILIDYLTLMVPNCGKSDGSYDKYGQVATELRELSKHFGCPVISACQTNRSGFNNENANLDNASESMKLSMTADFVGILLPDKEDNHRIRMKISKNRSGGNINKVVYFDLHPESLKLTEGTMPTTKKDVVITDNKKTEICMYCKHEGPAWEIGRHHNNNCKENPKNINSL